MGRKGYAAVTGIVAVAVACAWLVWAPAGQPPGAADQQAAGAKAAGPGDRAADSSALPAGPARLAGNFRLDYSVRIELPAAAGGSRTAAVSLGGELQGVALTADVDGAWLALRARGAKLTADDLARQASGLGDAKVPAGLEEPFTVRFDHDGRVQEVRFGAGLPVGVQALWASLVRDLQFVVPARTDGRTWQTDEENVNARVQATYARRADGSFAKQWQTGNDGMFAGSAEGEFRFATDHLATAHVRAEGRSGAGVGRKVGEFTSDIRLTWQGAGDARWARGLDPGKLLAFDAETAVPKASARAAEVALPDFEARVATAGAARSPHAVADERNTLARSIRARPAEAQAVRDRLRAGHLAEPVERAYIEALVQAGSPAAQSAMADLLGDAALDMAMQMRLLTGSAFFRAPDPAFVAALQSLADHRAERPELADGAKVTWGALIGHAARQDPAEGERLLRPMLDQATPRILYGQPGIAGSSQPPLTLAASAAERAAWLDGLGNAGLATSAPLVVQALQDQSDRVRKCAAQALRFLPPPAVKPAMVKAMKQEESIFVREALLLAARYQGPEHMLDFATHALKDDESEHVRSAAAFTIATWAADTPALKSVLQAALDTEKSDNVRESLKNYLQPGRTQPPFVPVGKGPAAATLGGQP